MSQQLRMQLSSALVKLASLQRRATDNPQAALVPALLIELERSLHEVETACEELKTQADRLAEQRDSALAHERRYRELFEFAPAPYIITDGQGTVTAANHAAGELLNVTTRFLTGKPLALFVGDRRPEFLDALASIARATEPVEQKLLIKPRERAKVRVNAIARVIVDGSSPALWWVFLRDAKGQPAAGNGSAPDADRSSPTTDLSSHLDPRSDNL